MKSGKKTIKRKKSSLQANRHRAGAGGNSKTIFWGFGGKSDHRSPEAGRSLIKAPLVGWVVRWQVVDRKSATAGPPTLVEYTLNTDDIANKQP